MSASKQACSQMKGNIIKKKNSPKKAKSKQGWLCCSGSSRGTTLQGCNKMLTHSVTRQLSQCGFFALFFFTSFLCFHNMLLNATLTGDFFFQDAGIYIYIYIFFLGGGVSWDSTSQGALASAARGADGSGKLQLPLVSYTSDQP